ncbi:hypothetical protein DFH11DRAFT_1501713, partial [Phellopilus nigrolimitatus]
YAGWGPDVTRLLSWIGSPGAPSAWSVHAVDPPYVRGCATLLGDAAHAMLLRTGQALEDTLVLITSLTRPFSNQAVLQAYELVRLPRANMAISASTHAGKVYDGCRPSGPSSAHGTKYGWVGCRLARGS